MSVAYITRRGGGANLNFKIVGGTSAPANPNENTIWVNTSQKITGYYFSATQPENMDDGEVWISIGKSSPVAFNSLKKNTVQVYPLSAKQYVSGEWVNKTAKTYQSGAWRDWIVYLIQNGVEKVDFELRTGVTTLSIVMSKTQETDRIVYSLSSSGGVGNGAYGMYYKNVDLTYVDTIEITASVSKNALDTIQLAVLSNIPDKTTDTAFEQAKVASAYITAQTLTTLSIDVSSLTGVHPVGLVIYQAFNATLTVSDFRYF